MKHFKKTKKKATALCLEILDNMLSAQEFCESKVDSVKRQDFAAAKMQMDIERQYLDLIPERKKIKRLLKKAMS